MRAHTQVAYSLLSIKCMCTLKTYKLKMLNDQLRLYYIIFNQVLELQKNDLQKTLFKSRLKKEEIVTMSAESPPARPPQ